MQLETKTAMPEYPFISYQNPYVEPLVMKDTVAHVDTLCQADTAALCDSLVPGFMTTGFGGVVNPMPRVTYDVLLGWNLVALGLMLLLIVINRQLYPRQFRQILSVPGGVAHTNQLLREWSPVGSFIGVSFIAAYVVLMALFVQKSCVILSRDIVQYNTPRVFGIIVSVVAAWVLLRYAILYFFNWLFDMKDAVDRQMTVQLSFSIFSFLVMLPVLLLLLYNPYSLFVWIGFGIIALAALMRLVYGLVETRVATKISSFFIFLYLCALEIAPVAILITAGMRYFRNGSVF